MIQLPDFLVGGSVYFEFQLVLPSDNATPVNADAFPTCVVVRNGVAGSDSVTIAPLSGIAGGYSLTYDPADDAEGENIIFRILATITDANFNGGSPASHRAFYATRCKAGATNISRTIAGNVEDGENNWDAATGTIGTTTADLVWQRLIVATRVPTSRTASTVTLNSNSNASIGMVLHLWDLSNNRLIHVAVVTEIVSSTSVGFDPPYTGSATVDRVSFYRLGSLIPPTVAAIQSGLALEATLEAMQGTGFDTATDSLVEIRAAVDAGGDATEAKQDAILAAIQGAQVIQVPSPNVGGNLVLTQGDTYDGIGNPKAQWNVTTDYTDGWAVVLTIRDKDDAVVYTTTGTVDSATVVSVAITTPTVAPMVGCPGSWQGKFDVQLSKAGSVKTIALGVVYVNEDQTR